MLAEFEKVFRKLEQQVTLRGQSRLNNYSFKHMVYGLRYYYRLLGVNKNAIALPSLKKDTKLPVILNHLELKELFAAPTLLKQRVVPTLIYSAGLRVQEVINSHFGTETGGS